MDKFIKIRFQVPSQARQTRLLNPLQFWDTRSPNPIMSIDCGERVYCADVEYPMAVVGTAGRGIIIYTLEGQPKEFKRIDPPLKYQHRCISIFRDKKGSPTGEE